jgi:rRNA maturation protein Rpf1
MRKRKKILLTTSRRPTSRIRSFCHDFAGSLPNIVRINRGKLNRDGIIEKAFEINADRVIIVDRWKGGSGKIHLFAIEETEPNPVNLLIYIKGLKLRREFKMKTKPVKSFIITMSNTSSRGRKIAESLAHFFDISMLPSKQAIHKYSASMHISTDASGRPTITFVLLPELTEIGPRLSLAKVMFFGKA